MSSGIGKRRCGRGWTQATDAEKAGRFFIPSRLNCQSYKGYFFVVLSTETTPGSCAGCVSATSSVRVVNASFSNTLGPWRHQKLSPKKVNGPV